MNLRNKFFILITIGVFLTGQWGCASYRPLTTGYHAPTSFLKEQARVMVWANHLSVEEGILEWFHERGGAAPPPKLLQEATRDRGTVPLPILPDDLVLLEQAKHLGGQELIIGEAHLIPAPVDEWGIGHFFAHVAVYSFQVSTGRFLWSGSGQVNHPQRDPKTSLKKLTKMALTRATCPGEDNKEVVETYGGFAVGTSSKDWESICVLAPETYEWGSW